MGAIVRGILTRISPLCWLAAASLTMAITVDPDLDDLAAVTWVVVAAVAAFAGTVAGAVEAASRRDIAVLGAALYEAISDPADAPSETP